MIISRYRVSQYVTSLDDVESTLNLTSLTERDGGRYSCLASNKAGTSTHTQHIRIFGKGARKKTCILSRKVYVFYSLKMENCTTIVHLLSNLILPYGRVIR